MSLEESSILFKNKEEIEYEISELKSMISEFKEVKNVLNKLPKKVQHEIMVPLGPLAFVPGYIVNTNKVLMLLGTDIYAERTTYESLKTINRRTSQAEECLKNLEKNLFKIEESIKLKDDLIHNNNKYSKNVNFCNDTVEIREEIDNNQDLIPPPLIPDSKCIPYIPDSHIDEINETNKLESNLSNLEIDKEITNNSFNDKKPMSIFRKRMLEK